MSAHRHGWWRKVYTKIWRDPRFLGLSNADKVFWLYLLTGPQVNRIGIFSFSPGRAAEDLDISVDEVRSRLASVCAVFGWRYDPVGRVVWIPSWRRYNPVDNSKNLKGFLSDLPEVHDSPLLEEFAQRTADLPDHYLAIFKERVSARVTRTSETGTASATLTAMASATGSAITTDPELDADADPDPDPDEQRDRAREQSVVGRSPAVLDIDRQPTSATPVHPFDGFSGRRRLKAEQQAQAEVAEVRARTAGLLTKVGRL